MKFLSAGIKHLNCFTDGQSVSYWKFLYCGRGQWSDESENLQGTWTKISNNKKSALSLTRLSTIGKQKGKHPLHLEKRLVFLSSISRPPKVFLDQIWQEQESSSSGQLSCSLLVTAQTIFPPHSPLQMAFTIELDVIQYLFFPLSYEELWDWRY